MPVANANADPLYACEAYDLRLAYDCDDVWLGAVTCWLVDADGAPLDEGEGSIECSVSCAVEGGGVYSLDVYGPDGEPIALHATALGEVERKCNDHVEWWIASERAERRNEDRADYDRGDWR